MTPNVSPSNPQPFNVLHIGFEHLARTPRSKWGLFVAMLETLHYFEFEGLRPVSPASAPLERLQTGVPFVLLRAWLNCLPEELAVALRTAQQLRSIEASQGDFLEVLRMTEVKCAGRSISRRFAATSGEVVDICCEAVGDQLITIAMRGTATPDGGVQGNIYLPSIRASSVDTFVRLSRDGLARLPEFRSQVAEAVAPIARTPRNSFRKWGDYWTLAYVAGDGTVEEPPPWSHRVGFEMIFRLLYDPGSIAAEFREFQQLLPTTDQKSIDNVRRRLGEIEKLLPESDLQTRIDLEDEQKELQDYLSVNLSPTGAIRLVGSDRDRAMNRFRNAINYALDHAHAAAPRWVEHLRASILYGGCEYPQYRPKQLVEWWDAS